MRTLTAPFSHIGHCMVDDYNYNDLITFIKFVIDKPLNIIFIYGFVF